MEKDMKTSHLLFDEAPLIVRPQLAVRVGLNEALVLQQIHYWLENKRKSTKEKDLANEKTYVNGRFWTYDTYEQWQEQFPFWSVSTIERIFKGLEKTGILISDNFNNWKADRTKWYTIDYDALDKYEKPKRKSKHDKDKKNVDIEQSVNLTESITKQSVNLTESVVEQSVKLTGAIPQVEGSNPSSWGEDNVNLMGAIPKTSSKSSSETSDEDFFNSSSSIKEKKQELDIQLELFKEEEEEKDLIEIKRNLMYLGFEISASEIMRTNNQINETINLMMKRGLLDFDEKDVANAIEHYKEECMKRQIGQPPVFFVNGFEMKLNQRHSYNIGNLERSEKQEQYQKQLGSFKMYDWLNES